MTKQKDIFNIFTIQNHIKINKEALSLLTSSDLDINYIVKEYKNVSSSNYINIDLLKSILNRQSTISSYPYRYISLIEHYKFLRNLYKEISEISNLKNSISCIFGYVYINKENIKVIEDYSGIIKIKGCQYKNKFIYLTGKKEGDTFTVINKESSEFSLDDCPLDLNINISRVNSCINILSKDTPSFIWEIEDETHKILKIKNYNICIINKVVITEIEDIPIYLDNYNFNWRENWNYFYREPFDIFIVLSERVKYIRKYKNTIFIMLPFEGSISIDKKC